MTPAASDSQTYAERTIVSEIYRRIWNWSKAVFFGTVKNMQWQIIDFFLRWCASAAALLDHAQPFHLSASPPDSRLDRWPVSKSNRCCRRSVSPRHQTRWRREQRSGKEESPSARQTLGIIQFAEQFGWVGEGGICMHNYNTCLLEKKLIADKIEHGGIFRPHRWVRLSLFCNVNRVCFSSSASNAKL